MVSVRTPSPSEEEGAGGEVERGTLAFFPYSAYPNPARNSRVATQEKVPMHMATPRSPQERIIIALNCTQPEAIATSRDVARLLKRFVGGFLIRGRMGDQTEIKAMQRSLRRLGLPVFLDVTHATPDPDEALQRARTVVKETTAQLFAFPLWHDVRTLTLAAGLSFSCQMLGIPLPDSCQDDDACVKRFGDGYDAILMRHIRRFALLGGKIVLCNAKDIALLKRDPELRRIEKERGSDVLYMASGANDFFPHPRRQDELPRISPNKAMQAGSELLVYSIQDLDAAGGDPIVLVDHLIQVIEEVHPSLHIRAAAQIL